MLYSPVWLVRYFALSYYPPIGPVSYPSIWLVLYPSVWLIYHRFIMIILIEKMNYFYDYIYSLTQVESYVYLIPEVTEVKIKS